LFKSPLLPDVEALGPCTQDEKKNTLEATGAKAVTAIPTAVIAPTFEIMNLPAGNNS
jgi:hypothetical protein